MILVIGCSGFIGFGLCKLLLYNGLCVTGIDFMECANDSFSMARLKELKENKMFQLFLFNKDDLKSVETLFNFAHYQCVCLLSDCDNRDFQNKISECVEKYKTQIFLQEENYGSEDSYKDYRITCLYNDILSKIVY